MDNFFDPASWTYTENPSFNFANTGTLTPELAPASYDLAPTISVSTGEVNRSADDSSLSGITGFVRASGQSLLDAWGTVQGLSNQKSQMELNRTIAAGQIQAATAQAKSQADVATITAQTTAQVEKLRAAAQVAEAQAKADAAKNGGVYVPAAKSLSLPIILALVGVAFVVARTGKGAK